MARSANCRTAAIGEASPFGSDTSANTVGTYVNPQELIHPPI